MRVALLAELERRKLVPGPPQWVKLLRETRGADQIAVVRAAAAHPSAAVTQELVALLASQDALLVSAAAISLGVPGNEKAVEPLGRLLASNDERVRMAAIRGLGRIGTPSAQARLAQAAPSHPDPATRRRAGAEVARASREAGGILSPCASHQARWSREKSSSTASPSPRAPP